jgi:hypothetical protein
MQVLRKPRKLANSAKSETMAFSNIAGKNYPISVAYWLPGKIQHCVPLTYAVR